MNIELTFYKKYANRNTTTEFNYVFTFIHKCINEIDPIWSFLFSEIKFKDNWTIEILLQLINLIIT